MLRSLKDLTGYVLRARDGEIGRCHDFLFEDESWTVRYMVADTHKWLPGKKVLVSPTALGHNDWASRRFDVDLTREQIENSPPLESDAPVSRRYELRWYEYYGWPHYWGGPYLWGPVATPRALRDAAGASVTQTGELASDPPQGELRSARELKGYRIAARDREVGKLADFIVDDETWVLRYLVVATRTWLPSGQVIFSYRWLDGVDWAQRTAQVGLRAQDIEQAPAYDPSQPINREYETRLYDFYGRPQHSP